MFRKTLAAGVAGFLLLGTVAGLQAGSTGGPRITDDSVAAYDTHTYTVRFYAGETARVGVVGDGDSDLDLMVYDENGHLIVSDTRYGDRCLVTWTPKWTGTFHIKVVNRGAVYNDYRIGVN